MTASDRPELTSPSLVFPDLSADLLEIYRNLPPVKLGILASGNGSNFEAVVQAIADGRLRAEVALVIYNNPGAKVAVRAERWGVPSHCIDHRQFVSREAFDYEVVSALQRAGVEWVVMAGWMRRVTEVFLEGYRDRAINIHPSLLPSFPGMRAIDQAIAARVKLAGCTAHLVTLEVDCGPILVQAAVPVLATDTVETLHARVQVQEHRILPQAIALATAQAAHHRQHPQPHP